MRSPEKILITGANGQIGTVLTQTLQEKYGRDNVIASDIRAEESFSGHFERIDVLDVKRLEKVVVDKEITQIYHLAAILSAKGEKDPRWAWNLNMNGLFNVLDVGFRQQLRKIFFPSSIAVFGNYTPKTNTSQAHFLDPNTVYGISKAAGEYWCNYYRNNYELDVRSLRFPGIIGYQTLAGGGTTDYAVDIFHAAIKHGTYECFLKPNTRLPMMYMDDAIKCVCDMMHAPYEAITFHGAYNIGAIDFTPAEIAAEIKKHIPNFTITYEPDFRQSIADTWPDSIDDALAKKDWGWSPDFDLAKMTAEMLSQLGKKYNPKGNSRQS